MGVRSFIAVEFDDPVILGSLGRVQRTLEGTGADIKSVEGENMHLTLKFLGDVEEVLLEEVKEFVTRVEFQPFEMELRGIGAFPNLRRPRVVWAGVSRGVSEMEAVFNDLEAGLSKLGFRREGRRFSPHLTLARVRSGRNRERLAEAIGEAEEVEFGAFEVAHVKLKSSVLTPRGPIYSTLTPSGG
ncbi:MAG TPA: RNA 2',3'-cyclic phosphodiesterase [Patescibacteria group bacterium]|nr:RNA 2',3'-cyclic phosphodiesterase [Patescibacteria group bacterium]